jgi:sucrose-6F-phosphate phosphohydrolase
MERLNLLISDLDGTLLGDDAALDEFADWYTVARSEFRLVYTSGRFVDSIYESIRDWNLPEPDAIIGGVGTQIYDVAAGKLLPMWPPSTFDWNPHIVRAICASHRELTPQADHFLSYHKVSFCGKTLDHVFIEHLTREITVAGQGVTVVYSSDRDLDILPAGANKGAAATYLVRSWNIDPQRVIVAGDSGNDAAMLDAGFRGIVVGNAGPELHSLVAPHIYHAKSEFAAGILEGLDYWLPGSFDCARFRNVQSCGDPDVDHDTRE